MQNLTSSNELSRGTVRHFSDLMIVCSRSITTFMRDIGQQQRSANHASFMHHVSPTPHRPTKELMPILLLRGRSSTPSTQSRATEQQNSRQEALAGKTTTRPDLQPIQTHLVYFLSFLAPPLTFSVPLNFLLRFFLCFRCCLLAFSILVAWPTLTSLYRGSNFFMASTES